MQQIPHNGDDPQPEAPQPKRPPGLNIGTYNIRDGRSFGLPQAIRAVQLGNYDLMVVTETKIPDSIYCKNRLGYDVVVSRALPGPNGGAQGGVGLITRERKEGWDIESTRFHGPNVLSCVVVSGQKRMPLIGVYLPPSTLDHLPDLEAALNRFPNSDPIVLGDLNADIHDLSTARNQQVAAFLSTFGLLDMLHHFRPRKRYRHNQTWWQLRQGEVVRSRCDYIMGTDRRLFEMVGLRNPRNYSSDHFAVKARLLRKPTRCHNKYLRGRRQFPLKVPTAVPRPIDEAYKALKELVAKSPAPLYQERPQWMSAESIRLIDARAALRRNPRHNRNQARQLTRDLHRSLAADAKRRAETAAEEIGSMMDVGPDDQPDLQGAYDILKRWYKHASARQPKPSRQDLTKVANDFHALYSKELPSPPGLRIPSHVTPFDINDDVPSDDEIQAAVQRLKSNRAGGHSHIKAEHFKEWMAEAYPEGEQDPYRERWDQLVTLVQDIWTAGEVPTELTWVVLAVLPKGDHDTRGIGLIEVLHKLLEAIIDTRIKEAVQYHDILHGFRAQRGTGTAILELKLLMELASIDLRPLFLLFLDLRKAYDCVDRERALETLQDYGAGPNMVRILQALWTDQQIIPRARGYYGPAFSATRGATQGGLLSPTLFNVVLDAIIRHWLSLVIDDDGVVQEGLGLTVAERLSLFYADDGLISAREEEWWQGAVNVLVGIFRRFGLQANAAKSKAMVSFPGSIRQSESDEAYARRMTGEGDSYRQRLRRRVNCFVCQKELAAGSLKQHLRSAHGREPPVDWNLLPVRQGEIDTVQYNVSFPTHVNEIDCPVPNCPGRSRSRSGLRNHFGRRHSDDLLCITEEIYPYPRCERCGHQVPPNQLNNRHYNSDACRNGTARKRQRESLQTLFEASRVSVRINNIPLEKLETFVYLGRPISYNNSDWPAVYRNLKKAQQRWGMVSRVLERTGASAKTRGMFYKAVVQAVLLYGCESWVITDAMRRVLEGFHHRVARRISGLVAQRINDTEWYYPPIKDALKQAGLWPMREYIRRRQASITQWIATRPIFELCQAAVPAPGASKMLRWWEQDHSPLEEEEEDDDDDVADGDDGTVA